MDWASSLLHSWPFLDPDTVLWFSSCAPGRASPHLGCTHAMDVPLKTLHRMWLTQALGESHWEAPQPDQHLGNHSVAVACPLEILPLFPTQPVFSPCALSPMDTLQSRQAQ